MSLKPCNNNLSWNCKSYVLKPNLRDHYATSVVFVTLTSFLSISLKFRDFCENNCRNYSSVLPRELSRFNLTSENANDYAFYLKNFLTRTFLFARKLFPRSLIKFLG